MLNTIPGQPEKLLALTAAAGVEVEPIWATLLAKALKGKDIVELLTSLTSAENASVNALMGVDTVSPDPRGTHVDEATKGHGDDGYGSEDDLVRFANI
jgi:large subunit ribosomal protein LP1